MKKQPSKIEDVITTVIAFFLSFVITTAIWALRHVVWPVLRLCARAMLNGLRRLLTRTKVLKAPKAVNELPTPEIFKGAPNLARARQVRF